MKHQLVWVVPYVLNNALHVAARLEPARVLATLGWDVTIVAIGPRHSESRMGIQIEYFPTSDLYLIRHLQFHLLVALFVIRSWTRWDIVFFQHISGLWLLPLRLCRLFRAGPLIVMDTRDLNDIVHGDWKARLQRQVFWLVHRMANLVADGQTAITPRMVELVGIPTHKILGIWPSGVRQEEFSPARSVRRWPRDAEPVRLMYIGTLLRKRNLSLMAETVIKANENHMSFEYVLVGDGQERVRLEEVSKRSAGAIKVLPPVPHNEIPDLLAQAHVGVTSLPSVNDVKYAASSPIKLFEYIAAGLPVLATRSACHTEVADGRHYVFWAEDATEDSLYAALENVWSAREYLQTLSDEASQSAEDWTWQAAGEKLHCALCEGLQRVRRR